MHNRKARFVDKNNMIMEETSSEGSEEVLEANNRFGKLPVKKPESIEEMDFTSDFSADDCEIERVNS